MGALVTSRTFVLIHGAFAGGWCWRRVASLLQSTGHLVISPTLTGLADRSHLLSKEINLDTHILDIANIIEWEDLGDVCLVAHSYGGFPGSGALEQIGSRVSSIVWVDALIPQNGEKTIDLALERTRKAALAAIEKGDLGLRAPPAAFFLVNERDVTYVDSKLTPHPAATYFQPINLSGAREKIVKKTYIRTRFPSPGFDRALAFCHADPTWRTIENTIAGHFIMLDEPEWLAGQLLQAA
jgi:thioesterase domain-containing protein